MEIDFLSITVHSTLGGMHACHHELCVGLQTDPQGDVYNKGLRFDCIFTALNDQNLTFLHWHRSGPCANEGTLDFGGRPNPDPGIFNTLQVTSETNLSSQSVALVPTAPETKTEHEKKTE